MASYSRYTIGIRLTFENVALEIVGMNIHLASFCPVTIVERDNLLLPGNPSNGFVLFKGKLYSFVSIGALPGRFFFVLFLVLCLSPWVRCAVRGKLILRKTNFFPLPPFFLCLKRLGRTGVPACTCVDACVRVLSVVRVFVAHACPHCTAASLVSNSVLYCV